MSLKHELQNIISGNGSVRHGKAIRAITDYLGGKKEAISGAEKAELFKEQETQVLIDFLNFYPIVCASKPENPSGFDFKSAI